ncbi:MAG: FxsA family protein [Acidimicrobiales bacterium]|jgi:UPF0716 protein FxsA|nr:FxsA family protein [Acidimicrobiales bacterium]
MALLLVALFVVLPIVELYVIVTMSGLIGLLPTLALLLTVSLSGVWLVKRQGLGVWGRTQRTVQRGEVPAAEMVDGGLLLAAGSMLVVPGFVTDLAGLVLLLPPVRARFRDRLLGRWGDGSRVGAGRGYIDVEFVGDVTTRPARPGDPPPELGPGR